MGFNSDLIDSLKATFTTPTLESYYNDKLSGKSNLSYTSIADYPGDDLLRLELYFINYVEGAAASGDSNQFLNSILDCFHKIAVAHVQSLEFESNDFATIAHLDHRLRSDFIWNRVKYIKNFKLYRSDPEGDSLKCWNSKLVYLYVILKHLGTAKFDLHCEECGKMCIALDTSAVSRLVVLLSAMSRTQALENTFNYLFDQIAAFYWNYELLSLSFSNIAKTLVHNATINLQSLQDVRMASSDILHSLLSHRNVYSDLRHPSSETLVTMLGAFAMNTALYHSDICILSEDKENTFTNLYMALVVTHILRANLAAADRETLYGGAFGLKNQAYSEFVYLKVFVESFIRAFSEQLSRGGEVAAKLSGINSFLDHETYEFLTGLKFATKSEGLELVHCRIGVVLLFMLALHNQITTIRLNEVAHMRLLYSLPWSPAIQFCTTDSQLSYILPDFKKAVMECFGSEIYICNCLNFSASCIFDDFAKLYLARHSDPRELYYPTLFSFSAFLSNSFVVFDRKNSTSGSFRFDTEFIYRMVTRSLHDNRALFSDLSNIDTEKPGSFAQLVQWKWFSHSLSLAYTFNKTVSYLALLDSLIAQFIANAESGTDVLTLVDIYLSTHSSDPSLELQRSLSSNFLALNQNPLNLLLSIPIQVLVQLFRFRIFGNVLVLLLSKLNKYIYEGLPSFLNTTASQVDFFQLSMLQSASMINVAMELSGMLAKEARRQVRSLVAVLLSMNPAVYEAISFSGLPRTPHLRFTHEVFSPEVTLKPLVDNFAYYLRRCQEDQEEWEKSEIRVSHGQGKPNKTLDPLDKWDVALFHLYNIQLLALETYIPKEGHENSINVVQIENAVAFFWDFMQNNSEPLPPDFASNSVVLITKLHYLHPFLTRKSIAILSNLVTADIPRESRDALEEINRCLKLIEYNVMMASKDDKTS